MKMLSLLFLWLLAFSVWAAEGEKSCGAVDCAEVHVDASDKASLQRGARIFVNYCLSCHSASYMRYNRLGRDLDIPEALVKQDMLFTGAKIGDLMKVAMRKDDAQAWFSVPPPDLTLVARRRDPRWIYSYLRGFYRDDKTRSGWNNIVFPNVAMPNVLYELQGEQRAVFKTIEEKVPVERDGKLSEEVVTTRVFDRFELDKPGTESPTQYDQDMRDLTNFLVYLGEPAKLVRYRVGVYVLIFLAVFLLFAYLLKKEYWKDVH
jgi:ubiquinol-cytochrome c reductase cytochrome c1 subunit